MGIRQEWMPDSTHPGEMYLTSTHNALTSDDLWAVFSALALLDEAAAEVSLACMEAVRLEKDAHWETKGMRKLRTKLSELAAQLLSERGELEFLRDQAARAVAS